MRHYSDASLPQGLLPWQKYLLAYVLGIWAIKYPWAGLTGLVLLLLFLPFKKPGLNLLLFLIFSISLALAWFRLPEFPATIPEEILSSERILVSGMVMSVDGLPGRKQRIILDQLNIGRDDQAILLPGRMVWTWEDFPEHIFPGQHIQAHLNVRPIHGLANFGVWNSEFFWRTRAVFWRAYSRGEHFWFRLEQDKGPSSSLRQAMKKQTLAGLDAAGLPDHEKKQVQGLALALFFGDRHLVDPFLMDSIRLASLAHSLALSGLHLGIMAGMGFMLAALMGFFHPKIYLFMPFLKLGVILAVPLCLVYIWMGQAPPTLVRSGVMFASWGLFLLLNRKRVLLDGLFLAVAIITLLDPWAVFDLRLQLSVAAVSGIALFLPLLETVWKKLTIKPDSRIIKYFLGLAGVTMAANLILLPVQAWTFNYLSPHLYLNLIWLPVLGFIVLPAGFAGIFISFLPGLEWLAGIMFLVSGRFLYFFVHALDFMHHKDLLHPVITYRPAWQHILAFWVGMILIVYIRQIRSAGRSFLAGMTLVIFLVTFPFFKNYFETGLRLNIMDVGQGQGVVIELPDRRKIIVDGGGSWNPEYDLGKQVMVPSLTWRRWPDRLEMIILSHAHVDHYGGLIYPLNYLGANKYFHNGTWPGEMDKARLKGALRRQEVPEKQLKHGSIMDLGSGLILETLHPQDITRYEKLNDTSLVLRLSWHGKGLVLIPGDIESQGLRDLMKSGQDLSAQVVVLPHHGSRTSACPEFYQRINPDIAVVSRGFLNRFGLPHQEVLDIIRAKDIELLDTAIHGQVVVSWTTLDKPPAVIWARKITGPKGIPYWF